MARFLGIWHTNPVAPWPINPEEFSKLEEKMFAGIDSFMRQGLCKETGYFADKGGYVIGEGETADIFRAVNMFTPWLEFEVHEMISYEKGKEIMREICKAAVQRGVR